MLLGCLKFLKMTQGRTNVTGIPMYACIKVMASYCIFRTILNSGNLHMVLQLQLLLFDKEQYIKVSLRNIMLFHCSVVDQEVTILLISNNFIQLKYLLLDSIRPQNTIMKKTGTLAED